MFSRFIPSRLQDRPQARAIFRIASGMSFLMLAIFLTWMMTDAQYRPTIDSVPSHLGLNSTVPSGIGDAELYQRMLVNERRMHRQGLRLAFLALIASCSVFSSLLAVSLFAFHPTMRRAVVIAVLTFCWGAFLYSHANLDHYLFYRRVQSLLPDCRQAAVVLKKNWPTENGTLPGAGEFRVGGERISNYLFLELKPPYARQELLGYSIERSDDGNIHFDLLARPNWEIVFHPQSTQPDSYTSSWGHTFRLLRARKLEDRWFLVKYEVVPRVRQNINREKLD